jgi:hypothetical protein
VGDESTVFRAREAYNLDPSDPNYREDDPRHRRP